MKNCIRYVLLLLYLPTSVLFGMYIVGIIAMFIPVWFELIASVVLPILGIVGAWYISPKFKVYAVFLYYIVGLGLAYKFVFPSYYPEDYATPYEPTYIPFIITSVVGLSCILVLMFCGKSVITRRRT